MRPTGYNTSYLNITCVDEVEVTKHKKLEQLRAAHRALDGEIDVLSEQPFRDEFKEMRLKRERLQLRTLIADLEEELYPDIIA